MQSSLQTSKRIHNLHLVQHKDNPINPQAEILYRALIKLEASSKTCRLQALMAKI